MARRPLDALNNEIDPSDPANRGMDTPEMPPQDENPSDGGPAVIGTPNDIGQTGGLIQPPNPFEGDLGPEVGLDGQPTSGGGTTPPAGGGGTTPADGLPANGDMGPLIAGRLKDLFSASTSPDLNDPALASERLQSQRNFENQRALLAERYGQEGLGQSGGFDTGVLGLGQERGAADLAAVGNLGQQRRQEILNALQLASGNQNTNNQLGFSIAQLQALLNAQGLQSLLAGSGA